MGEGKYIPSPEEMKKGEEMAGDIKKQEEWINDPRPVHEKGQPPFEILDKNRAEIMAGNIEKNKKMEIKPEVHQEGDWRVETGFACVVDYDTPLYELMKLAKVGGPIDMGIFPKQKEQSRVRQFRLLSYAGEISRGDVKVKLNGMLPKGMRTATLRELIAFVKAFPKLVEKRYIIAPDSVGSFQGITRRLDVVPYFEDDFHGRQISFIEANIHFSKPYSFLVVS